MLVVGLCADVGARRRGAHDANRAWRVVALVGVVIAATVLIMYAGELIAVTNVAPRTIWWMEGRFFLPLVALLALPVAAFTLASRRMAALMPVVLLLSGGLLASYSVVATRYFL